MNTIGAIASVVVPVTDQDAAVAFYLGHLGFTVRADFRLAPGFRWIEVAPSGAPAHSTKIALVPPRQGMWRPPGGETNINLQAADVVAAHARLRHLGVDVDQTVMTIGGQVPPMFSFRDLDGNVLHVVGAGADDA